MDLSILIPALNEEETIGIVIEKAKKWIKENNVNAEVLVANNASRDKTKKIALEKGARVIDVIEKGYGNALISGIEKVKGKYVIMGDADDSYDFSNITEFYEELKENDLVIGNRFYKMEKGAMKWTHRYIGTPVLTWMVRVLCGVKIHDINCGLRGFNRNKINELKLQSSGMEFATEMIIKAKKNNLEIKEIPIHFYKDKRNKKSHLRTIRDGFRHLRVIFFR